MNFIKPLSSFSLLSSWCLQGAFFQSQDNSLLGWNISNIYQNLRLSNPQMEGNLTEKQSLPNHFSIQNKVFLPDLTWISNVFLLNPISCKTTKTMITFYQTPVNIFFPRDRRGFLKQWWIPLITLHQRPRGFIFNHQTHLTSIDRLSETRELMPRSPLSLGPRTIFHATQGILFFSLVPPQRKCRRIFS